MVVDINKVIILDGIFTTIDRLAFRDSANTGMYNDQFWQWDSAESWTKRLIDEAADYFPIGGIYGYETWTHKNTRPDSDYHNNWHYDKDEVRWDRNHRLSFPMFTIVYYLKIDNLKGGEIKLETGITVEPKQNRMIIFGQAIKHRVNVFAGERHSIIINPWARKLEGYKT